VRRATGRFLLTSVTLTTIYLLVLASLDPGDVLTGMVVSVLIVGASRRAAAAGTGRRIPFPQLGAAPGLVVGTLADILRGTWHVALHIVGTHRFERPGIVAIPRGDRTVSGVAAWGYLTATSPDEIVVDVDEERGILLVHVLDARNPETVRARHQTLYERRQGRVFP
jgi:multisubunit Na+/H+ antiporter MnhE subunit